MRSVLREMPSPRPRHVGVYLLISEDVVVYVGQSTDVERRVDAHRFARPPMEYDRMLWIPLPEESLDAYEATLIYAIAPKHNTGAPKVSGEQRAAIAKELGLPPPDLANLAEFLSRRKGAYADAAVRRRAEQKMFAEARLERRDRVARFAAC